MQRMRFGDSFPELSRLQQSASDSNSLPRLLSGMNLRYVLRMVKMRHVNKPSDSKLIEFTATQESIERQLAVWIQELVQSNSELVPALQRLRRSYRVLRSGKPVTDVEEVL